MAIKRKQLTWIVVFSLFVLCTSRTIHAQTLVNSFNPGIGVINGLGFNDATETIYAHASFSNTIQLYDLAGTNTGSVPDPGDHGNDSDYFFTSVATNVAGTAVPAYTLFVIEHDSGVAQLIAADPTSGAVLATQDLGFVAGQLVGGTFNPSTGTFFAVDWGTEAIYEFDGSDGTLLNSFSIGAGFDVFYGDVEVNEADGNLYVVSSSHGFLRVLDPAGNFLGDVDVSGIGVSGMSGIAFRESTGEVLISSTSGTIYQVDGLPFIIRPDSFEVTRGTYVAGDESNLASSDNGDLQARRRSTDIQSRVEVEVKGVSTNATPDLLTFKHEGSVFARTDVTQIIEMFDYDLGSWEQLDSRLAGRFTDLVTEVIPAGDLSRFVEAGTGCMRARVRFVSINPRQQFQANIDQMIWNVD